MYTKKIVIKFVHISKLTVKLLLAIKKGITVSKLNANTCFLSTCEI